MNDKITQPVKKFGAREAALIGLLKVERDQGFAHIVLNQVLSGSAMDVPEKKLATEIFYGSLRMRAALDFILSKLLTRPLAEQSPQLLAVLRLGLYQLMYMDRIPEFSAVDEAVKIAKKYCSRQESKVVNAVLRNYLRRKDDLRLPGRELGEEYLITTLSHPRWLIKYLLEYQPFDEVEGFCLYNNASHKLSLRTNTLKITPERLAELLAAEGINTHQGRYAPESLIVDSGVNLSGNRLFKSGLFAPQGEASMLAALALSPHPGSVVYDLCAAPGSKSMHMAQLMANDGQIYAFDIHSSRVALIKNAAKQMGITIVDCLQADSRNLPAKYIGGADYLLLDAPCSGLGVLSRRADSRWRKQLSDIDQMADISFELLQASAKYLRRGGLLLFSTCTITRQENKNNLKRFLLEHDEFELAPLKNLLPLFTNQTDLDALEQGYIQFDPYHHGTEGFFISLLRKVK